MKRIILVVVVLIGTFSLKAQQISIFSQYYWNDFIINPAFTGIKNAPRIQMTYRNQWSGFQGSPKTFTFGGQMKVEKKNMGLGGVFFSDDHGGAIRQNGLMLNYSYQLKINQKSALSFGVAGVLNQYGYEGSTIDNVNPDEVLQANINQVVPDMNFGLVYSYNNKLLIGLSANQLLESRLRKFNSSNNSLYINQLNRQFNLSLSYFERLNSNFDIEPYTILRTTLIKFPQIEFGAKTTFKDFIFGGLSIRGGDAVIGMIGGNYRNFMIAYSYDFTFSQMRKYSGGSHEILLSYLFGKKVTKIVEVPTINLPTIVDMDEDRDGILNNSDKCPNLAGPMENFGCPWADSDDDGILDNKDNCPKEFGPIENKGCPYLDSDLDGVFDNIDPCPKTPGLQSNKGCPEIEQKVQELIDLAVKNLEFQVYKDVIEENSKPWLNKLALLLIEKKSMNLLISGHTDNNGDENENFLLSKRRAEAVQNYLISNGVDQFRIRTEYFGETKPIADNNTIEGRKKNRRVEIKIVFE